MLLSGLSIFIRKVASFCNFWTIRVLAFKVAAQAFGWILAGSHECCSKPGPVDAASTERAFARMPLACALR
jgi:hypothetical protein